MYLTERGKVQQSDWAAQLNTQIVAQDSARQQNSALTPKALTQYWLVMATLFKGYLFKGLHNMYNLFFSQSSGSRFSKYLFKHKTGFLQGLALVRYSRTIIWMVSSCSVKRALSGMWCYWERKKEWFQRPVTGFRECLATVVFPAARTNDSHRRVHHSYLDSKCF